MNKEQWCKKAKRESKKIVKVFNELEKEFPNINVEEITLKIPEEPFKVRYVKWDVFEIVQYIFELSQSQGKTKIKTNLPKEAEAFATKVYKANADDISGKYRQVYIRAIHYIGKAIEEESQKEKMLTDSIKLLEETKNIIENVNSKTYELEDKEELYELIRTMKKVFYISNNLKKAEPEVFGKISEICSKVSYENISEIGIQYYEITPEK